MICVHLLIKGVKDVIAIRASSRHLHEGQPVRGELVCLTSATSSFTINNHPVHEVLRNCLGLGKKETESVHVHRA